MKATPWFGPTTTPGQGGVFRRTFTPTSDDPVMSWWARWDVSSGAWMMGHHSVDAAAREKTPSPHQDTAHWCGLAERP